jgi:hypothetical protein
MARKKQAPNDVARYFFQCLMQNQLNVCWQLFSDKTQREFISWTLLDLYKIHNKAATAAQLGAPEVKLMFESNTLDLIIRFWRRFVQQSNAVYFHRYGYFEILEIEGKKATIEVRLDYENGQVDKVRLIMVHERNDWRFAYLESGLRF